MTDLLIDGLDDWVVTTLERSAAAEGLTLEEYARRLLVTFAVPDEPSLVGELRKMRGPDAARQEWDTVAVIAAEREARTARILGEDADEAWARAYREALAAQRDRGASPGEAA
jgi:hypothetical protein